MGFKGELRSNSTLNLVTTMFVHWRDTAVDFSFKWMEDNTMTMKSLTIERKKNKITFVWLVYNTVVCDIRHINWNQ